MSLHTSFLRVIMHHEPLKPAPLQPAATEVNRTTDYTVASVDSHASSGDDSRRESWCRNRKIDRFDSSSINHKALETFPMADYTGQTPS